MHGLRRAVALLLGLTAVTSPLRAQTDRGDRWQIALENGEYIWDIRLVRLTGDSLVFRRADSVGAVRLQRIDELRLIRKTEFRVGTDGGGALPALMGADDEVYSFAPLDYPARIRAVQQILLAHPPKP
ncbi:MAG: hypothetical protein SGJ01_06970 [Gemmatimonadota bacterium]|nr:hypothetical protein [Gemmatimonadota bacterium]